VIPLDMIERAINRDVDIYEGRAEVWGLDIARYGDDRCALVKRKGNWIMGSPVIWRGKDTMQTAGIVAREFFNVPEGKRPIAINCDVIGLGAGVVDRLDELGLPVRGVNVGERAEDADRFNRRRDELWWMARDWFAADDVCIPNAPALIADLVGPTYKPLSTGKIQVEAKDDMKKRGVASPDVADAFCLTFAGGEYANRANQAYAEDVFDPFDFDRERRRFHGEQEKAEGDFTI
jgi:hypothetical protein